MPNRSYLNPTHSPQLTNKQPLGCQSKYVHFMMNTERIQSKQCHGTCVSTRTANVCVGGCFALVLIRLHDKCSVPTLYHRMRLPASASPSAFADALLASVRRRMNSLHV